MKNGPFSLLFILLALSPALLSAEAEYRIDREELVLSYKKTEYRTSVAGNAVMNQFRRKDKIFFEIHVNPSLSELVIFNLKTKQFIKYFYTDYSINDSLDILTVLDPPHFSGEGGNLKKKIYINGAAVYECGKSSDIEVKVSPAEFEIFSGDRKIGLVKKNKKRWAYIPQ